MYFLIGYLVTLGISIDCLGNPLKTHRDGRLKEEGAYSFSHRILNCKVLFQNYSIILLSLSIKKEKPVFGILFNQLYNLRITNDF